jgi:hypothetical protein
MALDHYKRRLAHAQWTWREYGCDYCKHHVHKPRVKDRVSGRAEKRRARAEVRREIDKEIR